MAKKSLFSSKRGKDMEITEDDYPVEKKASFLSKPLFGSKSKAETFDFEAEEASGQEPAQEAKRGLFATAKKQDLGGGQPVKEKKSLALLAAKSKSKPKQDSNKGGQAYTMFGKPIKGNLMAVDYDDREVRVIIAKLRRQDLEISRTLKANLPEGVVLGGDILDPGVMADVLDQLMRDNDVTANYLFFAASNTDVIARPVTVSKMVDEADVEGLISFELQQYLDIDPSAYIIEYMPTAEAIVTNAAPDEDNRSLLAYAMPKRMVEQCLAIANELKMTPYVFDLRSNVLEKWLEKVEAINNRARHLAEQNVGIIHMAKDSTDVYLYAKGQFVTNNHLDRGYARLEEVMETPAIMRNLAGIATGEIDNFVVKDALDDWLMDTSTHILNTENFYTSTTGQVIQSFYIFGEEEICRNLTPILKTRVAREIEAIGTMDCQNMIWSMEADFSAEFVPAAAMLLRRAN